MATFNFSFELGVTLNQVLSFEMAGQIWSHYLKDDIPVNIHVVATSDLSSQILGGAILNRKTVDVATVETFLANDARSSLDQSAVTALGQDGTFEGYVGELVTEGQSMTLSLAQLKALGIEDPSSNSTDGYILFNSLEQRNVSWDYALDRTTAASDGSVDHLSIALHEIGHILGFFSGLDVQSGNLAKTSLLDLFRFSDRSKIQGINEFTNGQKAFFSIDGGDTALAPFSTGITKIDGFREEGFQASHWGTEASDTLGTGFQTSEDLFTALVDLGIDSGFEWAEPVIPNLYLSGLQGVVVSTAEQTRNIANSLFKLSLPSQLVEEDDGNNLGVLDPTLALEERSSVSALDLVAFDVLGYDIVENSDTPLDYEQLLVQAKQRVADFSGLTLQELELGLNQDQLLNQALGLPENSTDFNENIYERRRRRSRSRRSAFFWGEFDEDTNLQIYSTSSQSIVSSNQYLNQDDLSSSNSNPINQVNSYHLVTGNDRDVIQVSEGVKSIKSGMGNDLILLGNEHHAFLSSRGDADFITISDWNQSDKLVLHGTPQDYTLLGQQLYYQGDLVAKFEGVTDFKLETYLRGSDSGDTYFLGLEFSTDPLLNIANPLLNTFDFSGRENLWLFDPKTQFEFLQVTADLSPLDVFLQIPIQPDSFVGIQLLNGGYSDDIILGSDASEKLKGKHGQDQLVGAQGNDTLLGHDGDDVLNGTNSQSRGYGERDVMLGGEGRDRFILADEQGVFYSQNGREEQAIIRNFVEGEDIIQLQGDPSSYQMHVTKNQTLLSYEGDRIASLRDVNITTFDSFDFI